MISLLAALFFLIPLAVSPFTLDAVELPKQTLFVFLIAVASLFWLIQAFRERHFTLRLTPLFFLPLAFVASLFFSSLKSSSFALSFFGASSQEYISFITALIGVIFSFLIVQAVNEVRSQRFLLVSLLMSGLIVAVTTLLSLFNVPIFSWLAGNIFSTVGSFSSAALFLIIVTLIGNALLTFESTLRRLWFIVLIAALTTLTLLLLILLDAWVLWVILGIGALVQMALAMRVPLRAGLLFALSLLFLLINLPIPRPAFPLEVGPSFSMTWEVVKETLGDSETSVLFGSGPGTFLFDFTKHRPVELNATDFWNVRFDRGFSHTLTALSSIGVVSLFLIATFAVTVLVCLVKGPLSERSSQMFPLTAAAFVGWFPLLAAMDLYPSNMTLQVLFWGLTGLLLSALVRHEKTYLFFSGRQVGMIYTALAILLSVGFVTLLFATVQRYRAEVVFARAVALDVAGADTDKLTTTLDRAAALNRWNDVSYRALAEALTVRIAGELAKESVATEDGPMLQELIAAAVASAKRATELSPENVANWQTRGKVYEGIGSAVQGADAFAIEAYEIAHLLEPASPVHLTSLAQSIVREQENALVVAGRLNEKVDEVALLAAQETALRQAESLLLEAVELKSDYGPAHFELSLVYEKQGRLAEAVSKMEAVKQYHPNDVGVAFQLGILYMRQGKYEQAGAEFNRAVALVPTFANAHWYLGALYELQGQLPEAIAEVGQVLALDPENEVVKAKLARLQAGLAAVTIPEPIEE